MLQKLESSGMNLTPPATRGEVMRKTVFKVRSILQRFKRWFCQVILIYFLFYAAINSQGHIAMSSLQVEISWKIISVCT